MEESEFKATLRDVNTRNCAFAKTVLSRQGECEFAQKFLLAEREGMNCDDFAGQLRCQRWLDFLRHNCIFALKLDNPDAPLPHGKAVKLQVGGLIGLHKTLNHTPLELPVDNINALISQACATFASVNDTPLEHILPAIAAFQNKIRSRKKRT